MNFCDDMMINMFSSIKIDIKVPNYFNGIY